MAPKKTVSSSRVSEAGEKAIDKLDVKEFRERFSIPNGVSIDLVNEEAAMPLRKVKKTLSSSQGTIQRRAPCVRAPALPSNGDRAARFDKGRAKGLVAVRGVWAAITASGTEGPPCGLGGKGVIRLCYKTLLSARNLIAVVQESRNMKLKRLMLKDGESSWRIEIRKNEGTIRKAPGQKRGPDLLQRKLQEKRKLVKKHGKDVKEPTPPKEFPPPQITYEGEVMIEEPVNAAPHILSQAAPDACRG
ncbi:hypothetical protein CK203_113537 [Vitis vinifera]|uniref:Uncharacterized protein n=1 Tax=Vitis vinifera TaxID=29760 RepID=A0A438E8M9_VITVI|nr:hypothetical protein CK203_113537 [Vitis vinifera]